MNDVQGFRPVLSSPPDDAAAEVQQDPCAVRLQEYLHEAVNEIAPLEANMKIVHAKLMGILHRTCDFIDEHAEQWQRSPQGFATIKPVFETLTKLARENEKLARFVTRFERDND